MNMQLYRLRFLRAIVFGVIILIAFIFCFYELINLGKTNKSSVTSAAVIASSFTGSTNTSTVNFLNEGVTNNDTDHRSIKISVSASSVVLNVYQGYNQKTLSTQSFPSNEASYQEFLHALYNLGFISERMHPAVRAVAGQCPFGQKFTYSSNGISHVPSSLWTTTCPGAGVGTFAGKTQSINDLFRNQVPGYDNLVNDVNLN
jgi:hypothetical protein